MPLSQLCFVAGSKMKAEALRLRFPAWSQPRWCPSPLHRGTATAEVHGVKRQLRLPCPQQSAASQRIPCRCPGSSNGAYADAHLEDKRSVVRSRGSVEGQGSQPSSLPRGGVPVAPISVAAP